MMRGIAKRHGLFFFPNEVFLAGKSSLGPHGTNPYNAHIHMHMKKTGQFFKKRGFHETRVELVVDGPRKTAGCPQDTPMTRIPLAAAGSQSAL